jgi:Na+/H+-dicarboxylate symporter
MAENEGNGEGTGDQPVDETPSEETQPAEGDAAPSPNQPSTSQPSGDEPAADKPAADKPAADPKPAAAKPEQEEPAAHSDTFLGIKVHNLIFVGMVLGVLIGLFTYNLDHFDKLVLGGGEEVAGQVNLHGEEWIVQRPNGLEERYPVAEVTEVIRAQDTSSGVAYGYLVWWLNFFGKTLFMGALKMLIAPLIMASIIAGVVSLPGLDALKRIGFKTMGYYVMTTSVAVTIGLIAVLVIQPGKKEASTKIRQTKMAEHASLELQYTRTTGHSPRVEVVPEGQTEAPLSPEYREWLGAQMAEKAGSGHEAGRFAKIADAKGTTAGDILKNKLIQPMLTNPFESLASSNSLGIIFFSLLFGVFVVVVGAPAKPVADLVIAFNEVIIRITKFLMNFAPFCVMCIVAELVATDGTEVFAVLAWYCVTVIAGIAVHVAFLVTLASVLGGMSPMRLWQGISDAWLIAFTTRSSAATLPVTMRCVTNNLGVSPRVANFALPVGATMNMDGTALYEGVAVIFLIQIFGGLADVPIAQDPAAAITLVIFVTAVMASVGAAAVPDAGLVTMVLVANAVGLPEYYIPLIFAVDAFLDMFRTSTNVLGDTVGAIVVQKLEMRAGRPI